MKIAYIQQIKKQTGLLKKIVQRIKMIFNMIDIECENNRIMYNIPILENKRIRNHKTKKIAKKLNKRLYNSDTWHIVLSEYLENINQLKLELYSNNINILNGKRLFSYLTEEVIEHILRIQNREAKQAYISILINDINDINTQNIIILAQKVKLLNIVTNNISKFKSIEEHLYNEFGIMIKISNNKRKDLVKSQIIINMDYPQELVDKYTINNNAIIININESINIKSKKFNGININSFKIDMPQEKRIIGFRDEIVYESLAVGEFNYVKNMIKNDKLKIKNLLGINGIIDKTEFINLLDKYKIVE